MKFVADVNIAQKVIRWLSRNGHDILDIKRLKSINSDIQIIQLALEEKRIILTHDKDFLALTKFPKYQVGVIVIRLTIQNATHHLDKIKVALKDKSEDLLLSSLTIITEETTDSHPY